MTRSRNLALWLAVALAGCRQQAPPSVRVEVRSVGFDVAAQAPVIMLEDAERQLALPIWIGADEARAIALELEGVRPPRPLTHDLFKATLERMGVDLERVEIAELRESTYYARIHLSRKGEQIAMDSRPSDAIALAIRFQRPIFVATELINGQTTIPLSHLGRARDQASGDVEGISVQPLSRELAEYFALPAGRGVIVTDIGRGAPRGLMRGDIILAVDGAEVGSVADLRRRLGPAAAGDRVVHVRRGEQEIDVDLVPPKS